MMTYLNSQHFLTGGNKMFFVKNLNFLTKNSKINQNQLAAKLSISRQSINNMLRKDDLDPKASTIIKIAEVYNLTIDDLLLKDLSSSEE